MARDPRLHGVAPESDYIQRLRAEVVDAQRALTVAIERLDAQAQVVETDRILLSVRRLRLHNALRDHDDE